MHCPAAPLLEADAPDHETDFALEGTLAHAIGAKKLKNYLGYNDSEEVAEIEKLRDDFYCAEMEECSETYKTIVLEKFTEARVKTRDAMLLVEERLDFGNWIPEAFGTGDSIIIGDGLMEVIDYKHGKGVRVEATRNPQMMIYALGAYDRFCFEYNIRRVRMTIVQPRLDNISEYEISTPELIEWAENTLRPIARIAYEGTGPQNPYTWCQFCRVKSYCRALSLVSIATATECAEPKLLTKEEIEERVLPILATVKTWVAGVEQYVLDQALAGVNYKGYKLVEGRSVRRITDTDAAITALKEAGYQEADIIKPAELRSITDLEKQMGKKAFNAICGDLIVKPQGKPTLVPESDKRPAFNAAADDFKNIDL